MGETVAKAGRPQGGLKGATQEANALAGFLREITEGSGVRELAVRYEGVGKTLWGEYRSGVRIIPLGRLNAVVKDHFRDARSRQIMLAKARSLHEAAVAAEGRAGSALRSAPGPGPRDSGRPASAEGAVVRGETAQEPDEPSAGQQPAETAGGTDSSAPLGADTGESPAAVVPDGPHAGRTDGSSPKASPSDTAEPETHATDGDEGEQQIPPREPAHAADALLAGGPASAPEPDPGGKEDPAAQAADATRPTSSPGGADRAGPVRVRWAGAAVAVLVAASTAGGIFIATHMSDTTGESKQPEVLMSPPPSLSTPGSDLNLPGISTGPTTPDGSWPTPTPQPVSAPPSSAPASSSTPEVSRPEGKAGIVVATSSRLYRITADSEVEEYTGRAGSWTVIRKGTERIFTSPTTLYATDGKTGNIEQYDRSKKTWTVIGGPGSHFAATATHLYGVGTLGTMEYSGTPGVWHQVRGSTERIFTSPSTLYATDGKTGNIEQYDRTKKTWTVIGGPGSHFAATATHLYGVAPDRRNTFEYSGTPGVWHPVRGATERIFTTVSTLYAVDTGSGGSGKLREYDRSKKTWTAIGDPASSLAATEDHLYRVDADHSHVHEYSSKTHVWSPIAGS